MTTILETREDLSKQEIVVRVLERIYPESVFQVVSEQLRFAPFDVIELDRAGRLRALIEIKARDCYLEGLPLSVLARSLRGPHPETIPPSQFLGHKKRTDLLAICEKRGIQGYLVTSYNSGHVFRVNMRDTLQLPMEMMVREAARKSGLVGPNDTEPGYFVPVINGRREGIMTCIGEMTDDELRQYVNVRRDVFLEMWQKRRRAVD